MGSRSGPECAPREPSRRGLPRRAPPRPETSSRWFPTCTPGLQNGPADRGGHEPRSVGSPRAHWGGGRAVGTRGGSSRGRMAPRAPAPAGIGTCRPWIAEGMPICGRFQNERPSGSPEGRFRTGESGRGGAIRTLDLLNPIQVRYQAAPRPEAVESTTGGRAAGCARLGRRMRLTVTGSAPSERGLSRPRWRRPRLPPARSAPGRSLPRRRRPAPRAAGDTRTRRSGMRARPARTRGCRSRSARTRRS
jgi:hypothetical protein